MIINKIIIKNFRSVKGELSLEFEKGIIQIYGLNGAGKTTIKKAVEFAIFGFDSKRLGHDEIINDYYKKQAKKPYAKVILYINHNEKSYEIVRKAELINDEIKEVYLRLNNEMFDNISEGNEYIRELLFRHDEWSFCILDGEVDLKNKLKRKKIESNIKVLLRIPMILNLMKASEERFNWYEDTAHNVSEIKKQIWNKVKEIRFLIKKKQFDIDLLKDEIGETEDQKNLIAENLAELKKELPKFKKLYSDLDKFKEDEVEIRGKMKFCSRKNEEDEEMMPLHLILPVLKHNIINYLKLLNYSGGKIEKYYYELGELNGALNELKDLYHKLKDEFKEETDKKIEKLNKLLNEKLKVINLDSSKRISFDELEDFNKLLAVKQILNFIEENPVDVGKYRDRITELRQLEIEKRNLKAQIMNLERDINKKDKDSKLYEEKIDNKQNELNAINSKLSLLREQRRTMKNLGDLLDKEKNYLQDYQESEKNLTVSEKLKIIFKKILSILTELKEQNKKLKISRINRLMSKYFNEVTHKRGVFERIELTEEYEFRIHEKFTTVSPENRPSEGEKRVAALCFILALNEEFGNELLLLDDVWGHLDVEHILGIIKIINISPFKQIIVEGINKLSELKSIRNYHVFFDNRTKSTKIEAG